VNIVYIAASNIPSRMANNIHVMKMCQAFAHNGHTVTLIIPGKNEMEQEIPDIFEYYNVDKIFTVLYIPLSRIKGRGYYGYFAVKTAINIKADLIYCRNSASFYFSVNKKSKVIYETHLPRNNNKILSKYLFQRTIHHNSFQKLVVITKTLKDYYEQFYPFLKNKIQVAPDGADPISDSIVPIVLPNAGKRIQVGYIGHLYKGKGMEIVNRLAPLCPWADFHVVGGFESDIDFWKTQCKEIDNLVFHGYIPYNAVDSYILAFDVLLLPNQEKVIIKGGDDIGSWTSPLKAFEYMAAKKPILASDLPVLREVFENDYNALLAPPDNVELWAINLKKMHTDKELSQKIADNAYNDFMQKYTWFVRAREIVKDMST
jgi:glycosyltransferase involved in cell wall biosynthesis